MTGAAEAQRAIDDGFRIIAWGGDVWLLQDGLAAGVAGLRRMLPG